MATTDAFSAQIVELVRKMPDEAILELVKHQLGAFGVAPAHAVAPVAAVAAVAHGRRRENPARAVVSAVPLAKRGAPIAKRRPGRPRKSTTLSAERQGTLDDVERMVKASGGVSASDVSKSAGIPQTRAAAALKELKLTKRIFQGGDRRFARYAGDAKTAEQASMAARKTASGPSAAPPSAAPKKIARGSKRVPAGAGK